MSSRGRNRPVVDLENAEVRKFLIENGWRPPFPKMQFGSGMTQAAMEAAMTQAQIYANPPRIVRDPQPPPEEPMGPWTGGVTIDERRPHVRVEPVVFHMGDLDNSVDRAPGEE